MLKLLRLSTCPSAKYLVCWQANPKYLRRHSQGCFRTSGGYLLGTEQHLKDRRELLLKVYGAAIDEYRFNVKLTWDRTKFFLLLNSGLIAAGVGLFKVT